jgi:hypothetical protein
MIKLPPFKWLKRIISSSGRTLCLLVALTILAPQASSQENSSATSLYQQANQELIAAGLAALAERYESKSDNTWYATVPLDEELKRFVGNQKKAVGLVRQASRMREGNVAGELDPDPKKLSEIKLFSRNIITLMTLQSRLEHEKGNTEQAMDDLLTCLAMSNHIGQKAVMITKLVEIAVNQLATRAIVRTMPGMPASALQDFSEKLSQLPGSSTPSEVFLNERAYATKLMHQQREIYPEKTTQAMQNCYEDWADLMKLPMEDQAKQEEMISRKYASDPLVNHSLPMLSNMRNQMQLLAINHQLLVAGVQVLLKGEDALDLIKDPHSESSFAYSKTPNGFILRSQLKVRGKPVSLQFGR